MAANKRKRGALLQYNAPATLTFSLLCLFVLFLDFLTDGNSTVKLFCVYRSSWSDPLSYIRIFTHVLGHADFSHLSGLPVYRSAKAEISGGVANAFPLTLQEKYF